MELRHAISQIAEIHEHLARTEVFRGYRSITVASSGVVGIVAAAIQAVCISQPAERLSSYLTLWCVAAAINLGIVGVGLWSRTWHAGAVSRRTAAFAIEQFLPSIIAGGLLTFVISVRAADSIWMLPGLWSILFSLGVFASVRMLPRAVLFVGAWYLLGGIGALAIGPSAALTPWTMATIFGVGQLLAALVLYITLERPIEGAQE
jgi:hypothetical protein